MYFLRNGEQKALACDTYDLCGCNIWAIAQVVSYFRAMECYGCTEVLDRAFTGFTALPENAGESTERTWWEVLGVSERSDAGEVKRAYRELAKIHHPDVSGGNDKFLEVKRAYEMATSA